MLLTPPPTLGVRVVEGCSIDSFVDTTKQNYFLSHAHTDHHPGLSVFYPRAGQKIYCSAQTKAIILNRFPHLQAANVVSQIIAIPLLTSTVISGDVSVTLYYVNHCVGAVMFYFEIDGGSSTVLYTGDLRFDANTVQIPPRVDKLFLDCTFADRVAWNRFPSPLQVVSDIAQLIERRNSKCEVYLEAEMLGAEAIAVALAGKFGQRLCVRKAKYNELVAATPQLAQVLTLKKKGTRFYLVPSGTLSKLTEEQTRHKEQLFIKPSTQFFGSRSGNTLLRSESHIGKGFKSSNGAWHFLHSVHSSFQELAEFVGACNPSQIISITSVSRESLQELKAYTGKGKKQKKQKQQPFRENKRWKKK